MTNSAGSLLASGALIWLGNVLVFSLLYWMLDSGGPLARYRGEREFPDFAFTHQMSPELAPPGWRPQYVDYLILGLTTSTAFSPTDVMPMARWAKLTMALQSLLSLIVVGLVIARAVNVFTCRDGRHSQERAPRRAPRHGPARGRGSRDRLEHVPVARGGGGSRPPTTARRPRPASSRPRPRPARGSSPRSTSPPSSSGSTPTWRVTRSWRSSTAGASASSSGPPSRPGSRRARARIRGRR